MTGDRLDLKRVTALHLRLAAIRAEPRFDGVRGAAVRALAEAICWAQYEHHDTDEPGLFGRRIERWMGRPWGHIVRDVVRHDVPRWEPPDERYATYCPVPLTAGRRKGEACGKYPTHIGRVTDPTTGRWTRTGWCTRHRAYADAARIAEGVLQRTGTVPEPLPNRGGLLPVYAPLDGWPDWYAAACPGWKPPTVGIRATDWPVLAQVAAAEPPRLALIAGGGTDDGARGYTPGRGPAVQADGAPLPAGLRLITFTPPEEDR